MVGKVVIGGKQKMFGRKGRGLTLRSIRRRRGGKRRKRRF